MEVNGIKSINNNNKLNSIFTVFSNLTGEKNENPKYCVNLLKNLQKNRFSLGHNDNFVYSVKRVFKALGSTRLHSQCGCFACLACMLKYEVCTVEEVINLMKKEEKHIQGATKLEIKALNMAAVLACGAIIHSGLFVDQCPIIQTSILERLIEGGKKKSYLFTIACRLLIDLIQHCDEALFKNVVWPFCKMEISEDLTNCNSDNLHLLVVCMNKNSNITNKFLQKIKKSDISIFNIVAKFIFSNSVNSSHPIYQALAEILCQNSKNLVKLWPKFVNDYGKVNNSKDNLLVTLFFQITKHLQNADIVPSLFVPKFVDILITVLNFKKPKINMDNNYKLMAESSLNLIKRLLNNKLCSDNVKLETIKKLLLFPANLKFELKTGNKIIQHLVLQLNSASVLEIFELYREIIEDNLPKVGAKEGITERWNNKEKQIALHYLLKTINHPSIKNDVEVKLKQIKFIFALAFLNENKSNEDNSDFKKYSQECFYKAIMLQMPSLKELVFLLNELASFVNYNIINKKFKIFEEVSDWWNKQYKAVQKLQNEPNNKFFITVHVLLLYMGFQLFIDLELAKSSIEELLSCYSHLKNVEKKNTKLKKKKIEITNSIKEKPHWTEVTVDLILSLLSRENKLWRHVISCIFPQVVIHATPCALRQIIDALDPKSEELVLEELSSSKYDSESDERESESSLSDSEESDLEDCDQENKANDQLRLAVREALGYSAALTDDDSIDMDQMNSEEEKKLNESIAEAFKLFKSERRGKKKKQTKEEGELMHFRLRVLDLVEIYVMNGPSMQGCLDFILPLLNILEYAIKDQLQCPLRTRVDSVLKSLSLVKNFSCTNFVNDKTIKDLFQMIINKKDISALLFVEMAPRIADCATFLVRCCQFLDGIEAQQCLASEYEELLKAFCFSRDFKLPISMFQNVLRTTWKGNFKLARTLFECLSTDNVRIFKKMKLLELLKIFYKNEKLHNSCDEVMKSELNDIECNFVRAFVNYLKKYETNESKATEKMYVTFFSQIIVLINVAQTNYTKHRSNVKECSCWKDVISVLASTKTCSSNKKTRLQIANVAHALNIKLPNNGDNKTKEKAESNRKKNYEQKQVESEDIKEPPKKKRKKLDFKKESRKLRESSTNNLKVFKFSSVDLESLNNVE